MQNIIAKRMKAARLQEKLTQQQLSAQLGFKDRQTLAAIESGLRKVSADELLTAIKVLNRDLDYFTDPFRIDGEGYFSWRTSEGKTDLISEFESWAGRWLALYRYLTAHENKWTTPLRLSLTMKSSYEDAHHAAEWLSHEWDLGDVPAVSLEKAVEEKLRALVLYVDAIEGVSGAAFKLPELSAILINRNEPAGRRSFDLAHELFHLLTWETIRPEHFEENRLLKPMKRSEQLANCFASAMLMPEGILRTWWGYAPQKDDIKWSSWVNESALNLHVTPLALQWRLVQLGMLRKDEIVTAEHWSTENEKTEEMPRRFSLAFVKALKQGLEEGMVSVRRVSALVGLSIDKLADLFREHFLEVPFDI